MASRGYSFDTVDGRSFATPAPGVFLSPVREGGSGFPGWLVDFTRGDIRYFRRFGEESVYSLEKLGDGTFEFRDIDIDTLMYVMTPVYENGEFVRYDLEWEEYTTDDRPETIGDENGFALPVDEDGETWGEFTSDLDHVVLPVYLLEPDMMEVTEGAGEEEVIRYSLKYYLDLSFDASGKCVVWDYGTGESVVEFSFGEGKYDTRGRRVYSLGGLDWSVLFDDDGFSLYDDSGVRFGSGVEYLQEDDEGFDDGWGVDSLSSLALERYLERYPEDSRRHRSEELRSEVWDATVSANSNPLDKLAAIVRMFLDAGLEFSSPTWPIDMPPNCSRAVSGADAAITRTKTGWTVTGETEYDVTVAGEGDDTTWNFHGPNGGTQYILGPVGDGTFEVRSNSNELLYKVYPAESLEDFEPNGEYSSENLYPALGVTDADGGPAYLVDKPERSADPFERLTFAEFVDDVPLRKVDGAWITYANSPKYYESDSDNINYWRDLYDRHNVLAYRIAKPSEWDEDDREIYSVDLTKVAILSLLSLVSNKTGNQLAKMYGDPEALYTYQLFDNQQGGYNYLTRYSNDMVVVVNAKGNVVRYVTPEGLLYGPTWYLFGTVERRQVVDTNGDVLYTFISDDGDWNIFDADGNLVGHLFSSSTPNNEWTIAEGCQRLFTFLAAETTVVFDSDGNYTYRDKDGEVLLKSVVRVQSNQAGTLYLSVLDEDGVEIYRITPSGNTYQIDAANGVAFDTARAYETYSQGNMVLTRYWSVPYNRMMYSCTNDQLEGTFDDIVGAGEGDVPSPLSSGSHGVGGGTRSVSYSSSGSDAYTPRTLSADSTSSSSGNSSEAPMSDPDSIQDLMDSMSDFFDGINGVLAKDTNTSKGDDLDPDNPLQISQTETDGRLIADAVFSNPASMDIAQKHALQDAYDYTQAVTRISKMYSLGRADIYKEAQDYSETRTKRIEAKKASFLNAMERAKTIAEKSKG